MKASPENARFSSVILPHLDAAYNLARWLCGNDQDARDIAQEAAFRALRSFDTYRGGDAKSWLLTITRNTAFNWLRRSNRFVELQEESLEVQNVVTSDASPDRAMIREAETAAVNQAIEALPPEYREVIVMREMEGMSYREISQITGSPLGTVMSRLSRGRERLKILLLRRL